MKKNKKLRNSVREIYKTDDRVFSKDGFSKPNHRVLVTGQSRNGDHISVNKITTYKSKKENIKNTLHLPKKRKNLFQRAVLLIVNGILKVKSQESTYLQRMIH